MVVAEIHAPACCGVMTVCEHHGVMVGRTQSAAVTQSGRLSQATWSLRPGSYELYCSMPGHMKRGMRTRITIR